jgi:nitric oxide reductase NorD protein
MYAASAALKDLPRFAHGWREAAQSASLPDVARVLELFLCGLSGRALRIEAGEAPWTDTETVYLPARVHAFATRERNFLAYKAMAALAWAQTRFGTFAAGLGVAVAARPEAARWIAFLEAVRLGARIDRALPGLGRDLRFLQQPPADAALAAVLTRLERAEADLSDTLAVAARLDLSKPPPAWCYVGPLFPERVASAQAARIAREKDAFRLVIAQMRDELRTTGRPLTAEGETSAFSAGVSEPDETGERTLQLFFDGTPIAPPGDARNLVQSILQDLGELPPDYLAAAGPGAYRPDAGPGAPPRADEPPKQVEEGAAIHDEWDFARKHYRRGWCVLRERDVHPGDPGFVWRTLQKYRPQIASLKRTFEALRGEDRLHRRQPYGDAIDIDAVVAGLADRRAGRELPDRLFVRRHKIERSIAVMFLVDMSGSTKGWINDAEREALVLLAETLEVLGDRYAIYGFSGMTRKRCELFRVKRFDEPYGPTVKGRIAGIAPQDYTRMGVAIRHISQLLAREDARTRLLVTLSDGKPDDFGDNYRGEYGIEDTRQALLEARRSGIHPFCITIDEEARDYLPRMYGAANYVLVNEVRRLPLAVANVYRRLTA